MITTRARSVIGCIGAIAVIVIAGCLSTTHAGDRVAPAPCQHRVTRSIMHLASGDLRQDAVVHAIITDSAGGPLAGASVARMPGGPGAFADARGAATFRLSPRDLAHTDSSDITVRRIGYTPVHIRVHVAASDSIDIAASMCPGDGRLSDVPTSASPASPTRACLGPSPHSDAEIERLRQLVHSREPGDTTFRNAIHLPVVPDSAIHLVTDEAICARITRVWAADESALGVPPPYVTSRYVVAVGPVYVAFGPHWRPPGPPGTLVVGYEQYVVYDAQFRMLAPYLQ